MKKLIVFILIPLALGLHAQADEEAIKQVITTSYINGIQNRGSSDDIRNGFHPSFNMLRYVDNTVKPLPIEEWITNLENEKVKNTPLVTATGKFISIDITGTAAIVKLELYRNSEKTFTDYLVLYKFAEGWKIVSKTYYRHSK